MAVTTSTRAKLRPTLPERDRQTLASLFALDRRSLAVMRVGMGAMVLYSTAAGYLSPGGPVPDASGTIWTLLRVLMVAASLMLMAGFKTRPATIVCWLIYSHAIRTAFFTPGAPVPFESYVITLVLFWAMFLPLGDALSVDARRRDTTRIHGFVSVASAGLLIQVFFIYFSAGLTKDLGEWMLRPTALADVLANPAHGSAMGRALTEYPGVLAVLSIATVVIEIVLPLLLFVPGRRLRSRRTALVAAFVGFHVLLALLMELGVFPFVMIVVWCAFLPSDFWSRWSPDRSAAAEPQVDVDRSRSRAYVAAAALVMVVASNLVTWSVGAQSGWAATIQEIARYVPLYQQWTMFSIPSTL